MTVAMFHQFSSNLDCSFEDVSENCESRFVNSLLILHIVRFERALQIHSMFLSSSASQ